jgi:CheY-like chemotaxis protein
MLEHTTSGEKRRPALAQGFGHAVEPPERRGAGPTDAILLIEDDDDVAEAITHLLENDRYFVFRSPDALEALQELRSGLAPDIILLDLVMPRMDGWEFRVEQRRDPILSAIPIIALSADDSPKARAIDADIFLKKPVDEAALLSAIRSTRELLERRRRDEHAAQQERLSSLGVIAAGIAHEINNPLAAVIGNLELATRRCTRLLQGANPLPREAVVEVMKLLAEAQAGNARIAEVVRNVSTFAHPDTDEVTPLDVQSVLESSIRLVANEIRHRTRLERVYGQVPKVLGNAAKLGQVFLNLMIHAIHALGDEPRGGIIRIELAAQGDQVLISIGDSWPNVAPEAAERRFDPFLASRMRSLSHGMGLALSQRAILAMGGTLRLESEPARGSVFHVSLPAYQPGERGSQSFLRSTNAKKNVPRVLIIDDEEMMCSMLEATLAEAFEVTACLDAHHALEKLYQEDFDVVLCDLMMPVVSGMELYRQLSQNRPSVARRFIFMTGGTFTENARQFLAEPARRFVTKPFRIDELTRELNAVVRESAASSV